MKVLTICPGIHPYSIGGIETHVRNMVESLQSAGVKSDVMSEGNIYKFTDNTLSEFEQSYLERWKTLLQAEYDVVHLHGLVSHGALNAWLLENEILPLLLKSRNIPVVFTPHGGIDGVFAKSQESTLFSAYLEFLQRALYPLVDRFIAIYPTQLDTFESAGIPENKITFIPNGVEQGEQESFNTNSPTIVYLGSLKPHKRVSDLVEAVAQVPEVELVVAGPDRGSLSEIHEKVDSLNLRNRFRYEGMVDDSRKWELLNMAEIFVNPSEYEAFGLAAAEAMSVGTPVISATNPGSRYLLEDGEYGHLYEPGDVESLVFSIKSLLTDEELRTEISQKGKLRADDFNWTEIATSMAEVYESLL